MKAHGTRPERAIKALADTGLPVMNGAITTFLGTVLLGFGRSEIFRIFVSLFAANKKKQPGDAKKN